jgi:hypothetical protein
MEEEICGILCIVSTERDFIIISLISCVECFESKLRLQVYNIFPITYREYNDLKYYNIHKYNVDCKCGRRILWNQWRQKYNLKVSNLPTVEHINNIDDKLSNKVND